MPPVADLIAVFLMGLFGGAHCLGMCGGFSVLVARRGAWPAYAMGKTLTYAGLGVLAGLFGHVFLQIGGLQATLSVVVGLVLIVLGAASAGLIPDRFAGPDFITAWMGPRVGSLLGHVGPTGSFGVGVLNGLLPCGLVYAALMTAMRGGRPLEAALLMGVFGLATLPSLGVAAFLAARLPPTRRLVLVRVGGWIVVAFGVYTLWRAFMADGMH